MHQDLVAALAPDQQELVFHGRKLVVRELDCAASMPNAEGLTALEYSLRLIVLSVDDVESAAPAFTEEDLPALRNAGRRKMKPLIDAALRVNGLSVEANVKKSAAGPGSGESTT